MIVGRVKDLVGAFAELPQLPKMLSRSAIVDTLVQGCRAGLFVIRAFRPDRTERTYWREEPDPAVLKEPATEVVLPEAATLTDLSPALLVPGALPQLWTGATLSMAALYRYFGGGTVVQVEHGGYSEPLPIPGAAAAVIDTAVRQAVKEGKLWLTIGSASILAEEIPAGLLTAEAVLRVPPSPLSPDDVLPDSLSEAWREGKSTAQALFDALAKRAAMTLPWPLVQQAIDAALRIRLLEVAAGVWPCSPADAERVVLQIPQELPPVKPAKSPSPGVLVAEAELRSDQIQDLADEIADITRAAAGLDLRFYVRVELRGVSSSVDPAAVKLNELLQKVSGALRLH